ncbi:MAG TPA: hypothetical protein VEA69_25005 [Tepidisphaeraceae bacterium]|nr:hypothetical protein [Tepidisphaeraceae bacterium]
MYTDRVQNHSVNGLRGRRAFTLTEVLVIIAVIVVVLAMAVPLFNVFSASRSVDGAENVLSAALQRARSRAIGMQERRGLFVFTDPATGNAAMVTVVLVNRANVPVPVVELELDPSGQQTSDTEPLPSGVGVAFMGRDYNNASGTPLTFRPLGLIVFDAYGRLEQLEFTIRKDTFLAKRAELDGGTISIPAPNSNEALYSSVAMTFYERRAFGDGTTSANKPAETLKFDGDQPKWVSENGLAILFNRYNGTAFRAE